MKCINHFKYYNEIKYKYTFKYKNEKQNKTNYLVCFIGVTSFIALYLVVIVRVSKIRYFKMDICSIFMPT